MVIVFCPLSVNTDIEIDPVEFYNFSLSKQVNPNSFMIFSKQITFSLFSDN